MKIKLLFIAFVLSLNAYAQDKIYGKPEILKDKQVKILPIKKRVLNQEYTNFYSDEAMASFYKGMMLIEPKLLENRIFNVLDVVKLPASKYGQYYRIKIQDVTNNEILYYSYNENAYSLNEYYFEVVGGLTYPEGFFCDMVFKKFENIVFKVYTTTKIFTGIAIDKEINLRDGKEEYTLHIKDGSVNAPLKKTGVTISLDNGKKIILPKQNFTYENRNYQTVITLDKAQIELLKTSAITGIEMGGTKIFVYEPETKFMQEVFKCMIPMKQ